MVLSDTAWHPIVIEHKIHVTILSSVAHIWAVSHEVPTPGIDTVCRYFQALAKKFQMPGVLHIFHRTATS